MDCYPPKIPTINIYRSSTPNMIFDIFIRIAKFIIIFAKMFYISRIIDIFVDKRIILTYYEIGY
jgi:hypothetical protein